MAQKKYTGEQHFPASGRDIQNGIQNETTASIVVTSCYIYSYGNGPGCSQQMNPKDQCPHRDHCARYVLEVVYLPSRTGTYKWNTRRSRSITVSTADYTVMPDASGCEAVGTRTLTINAHQPLNGATEICTAGGTSTFSASGGTIYK
ncbi:MAG: hypothetical protein IPO92_11490 [Saprospiraceae bacterium]|nr:hypothetical protein [Saprospiraceae bacterium]